MTQMKKVAEDITAKLELGPEDDLLDVGCGSGLLLSLLRPQCRSAVGVDFSSAQIALGRRWFPDLTLVVGSAEELDNLNDGSVEHVIRPAIPEGRFSRLLCYSVWQCVDNWRDALDGFLRVLRRPGILLIGDVPNRQYKWRVYFQYARRLPGLLLRPKTFCDKLRDFLCATPWHWVDLNPVACYLEARGCSVDILAQHETNRQWGGAIDTYRFDMKVRVPDAPLRPRPKHGSREWNKVIIPAPLDCGMKPLWR